MLEVSCKKRFEEETALIGLYCFVCPKKLAIEAHLKKNCMNLAELTSATHSYHKMIEDNEQSNQK